MPNSKADKSYRKLWMNVYDTAWKKKQCSHLCNYDSWTTINKIIVLVLHNNYTATWCLKKKQPFTTQRNYTKICTFGKIVLETYYVNYLKHK